MKTFSLSLNLLMAAASLTSTTLVRSSKVASLRGSRQLTWEPYPADCNGPTCKTRIKDKDTPTDITVIRQYDNFTAPIQERRQDNDKPKQGGNKAQKTTKPTLITPKQDKKDQQGGPPPNDEAKPDEQVTQPTQGHTNKNKEETVDSALCIEGLVVGTWPPAHIQQEHKDSEPSAEEPMAVTSDPQAKKQNEEATQDGSTTLKTQGMYTNAVPTLLQCKQMPDSLCFSCYSIRHDKTTGMKAYSDFLSCTVDNIVSCIDCDRSNKGLFTQDCPLFYSWYLRNIQ